MYNENTIDVDKLEYLNVDEKEFEKNKVLKGDLFFTRSSLNTIGIDQCNIYLNDDKNVTFDGHIMSVRLNKNIADSKFIKFQFSTQKIRHQIMKKAKTNVMTTIGQENLLSIEY